jgi:hypothetical protein
VARLLRRGYRRLLGSGTYRLRFTERVDVMLVMLACDRDFPEVLVALRSFWCEVGEPTACTIVWDDTIDHDVRAILESLAAPIRVTMWTEYLDRIVEPGRVLVDYAVHRPMGKKLVVELGLTGSAERPLIYMDSDVLFLPGGGKDFRHRVRAADAPLFMQDVGPSFDERMPEPNEETPPANGGLFVLTRDLDWDEALRRLERLDAAESGGRGWTEQAALHLALRDSGAQPLPAEQYVLTSHDWDRFVGHDLRGVTCARHYSAESRWRMWITVSLIDLARIPRRLGEVVRGNQ